ncbi:Gametogenetin-binding protein 2 [Lamellibrachia satsuma]|nr:Gametogenetin-binding protein 2 [Lamellibrachia satsuma]
MARLAAVCRSADYLFERRQIPLVVDDNLTMVIQFSDTCVCCDKTSIKQKELDRFMQRFCALSNDEVAVALMVTNKEIFSLLFQMVPCVGCRRSVERLFQELVDSGRPALEPLVFTGGSVLSLKREYLFEPKAIFALFYVHGSKINTVMDSIPKSKKNKRCALHSLDSHKSKSMGSWMDIWEVLSHECREEVVLVDSDDLIDTLDKYLKKHRFCTECKSKVLRAYSILMGDLDSSKEKGYCPSLYDGLRCCPGERHLHIECETDFVAHLIARAEPDMSGSRRERHAKTMDIAQEEVLTCLGIYLCERLHRIKQKLRAEEQTWQILFCIGVDALRKNFELALEKKQGLALEKKQGISNLELMCEELQQEERAKELRQEHKRQKRRKKKNKLKHSSDNPDKENCMCDDDQTSATCDICIGRQMSVHPSSSSSSSSLCKCPAVQQQRPQQPRPHHHRDLGTGSRSDLGYSSGLDWCECCSMPSSQDGSESMCSHDGDSPLCHRNEHVEETCNSCNSHSGFNGHSSQAKSCREFGKSKCAPSHGPRTNGRATGYSTVTSLQDMLEAGCSSGEEEDFISEEEIRQFKANEKNLTTQRAELRETLRQRFASMRQRCMCVGSSDIDTDDTSPVVTMK